VAATLRAAVKLALKLVVLELDLTFDLPLCSTGQFREEIAGGRSGRELIARPRRSIT